MNPLKEQGPFGFSPRPPLYTNAAKAHVLVAFRLFTCQRAKYQTTPSLKSKNGPERGGGILARSESLSRLTHRRDKDFVVTSIPSATKTFYPAADFRCECSRDRFGAALKTSLARPGTKLDQPSGRLILRLPNPGVRQILSPLKSTQRTL